MGTISGSCIDGVWLTEPGIVSNEGTAMVDANPRLAVWETGTGIISEMGWYPSTVRESMVRSTKGALEMPQCEVFNWWR